jgi:hypothetical protein
MVKGTALPMSIRHKAKRAYGAAGAYYTPGFERFLTVHAATHIRQTLGHPIQREETLGRPTGRLFKSAL